MYKTTTTRFRKSCTNSLKPQIVASYKKPIEERFFYLSVYMPVAVRGNLMWVYIYTHGSLRKFNVGVYICSCQQEG